MRKILLKRVPLFICIIFFLLSIFFFLCIPSKRHVSLEPLYYSRFDQGVRFIYEAHLTPPTSNAYIERYELGNSDAKTVIYGDLETLNANTYLFRDVSDVYTQVINISEDDGSFYLYDKYADVTVCLYPISSTQH